MSEREYHQSRDLGRARSRTVDPSERMPTTGWPAADRHIALQRATNAREADAESAKRSARNGNRCTTSSTWPASSKSWPVVPERCN